MKKYFGIHGDNEYFIEMDYDLYGFSELLIPNENLSSPQMLILSGKLSTKNTKKYIIQETIDKMQKNIFNSKFVGCFYNNEHYYVFKSGFTFSSFCLNFNQLESLSETKEGKNSQNNEFQKIELELGNDDTYLFENHFSHDDLLFIKDIHKTGDYLIKTSKTDQNFRSDFNELNIYGFENNEKSKIIVKLGPQSLITPSEIVYFEQFSRKYNENSFLGCFMDENKIYLVQKGYEMDLASFDFKKKIHSMKPIDRLVLYHQIIKEMVKVERIGLVHMDIKPSNIMLDSEGNIHIIDFGITKKIDENENGAGTEFYKYPHKASDKHAKPFFDSYSFGALVIDLEHKARSLCDDFRSNFKTYKNYYNQKNALESSVMDNDSNEETNLFKNKHKPIKKQISDDQKKLLNTIFDIVDPEIWKEFNFEFNDSSTQNFNDLIVEIVFHLNQDFTPKRIDEIFEKCINDYYQTHDKKEKEMIVMELKKSRQLGGSYGKQDFI